LADILPVATALHRGAEAFWTFDANQKKRAGAEGLKFGG
jgi:predicted nucleic acid-binding protein